LDLHLSKFFLFLITIILVSPIYGESYKNCYVYIDTTKDFDHFILEKIPISIISKYLRKVEPITQGNEYKNLCKYSILVTENNGITFLTFKGENLNSFSQSKLSGVDGFRQSLLKSLFILLPEKRDLICEEEGFILESWGNS